MAQEYESLAQAARRAGLSTRTLRRRISPGLLPAGGADAEGACCGAGHVVVCLRRGGAGQDCRKADERGDSRSAAIQGPVEGPDRR